MDHFINQHFCHADCSEMFFMHIYNNTHKLKKERKTERKACAFINFQSLKREMGSHRFNILVLI